MRRYGIHRDEISFLVKVKSRWPWSKKHRYLLQGIGSNIWIHMNLSGDLGWAENEEFVVSFRKRQPDEFILQ